jgi:hypothetical protein
MELNKLYHAIWSSVFFIAVLWSLTRMSLRKYRSQSSVMLLHWRGSVTQTTIDMSIFQPQFQHYEVLSSSERLFILYIIKFYFRTCECHKYWSILSAFPRCRLYSGLFQNFYHGLTLILLTCRIWWASNNASRWQMGFISAFKGLINVLVFWSLQTLRWFPW